MIEQVATLPKLIGLHGKAGSGKSTVAEFLTGSYKNTYEESFAGPLKAGLSQLFGIPLDSFSDQEVKNQVDPYWGSSPRKLAQFFGTEIMRAQFGPDFWIRRMHGRLTGTILLENDGVYDPTDTVVISDVRFQDEYDYIIEQGGSIIHLTRPGADGTVGIQGHASEADILLHSTTNTYTIANTGSISDLKRAVAQAMVAITQF